MRGDELVGLGIPSVVIHSIEDSGDGLRQCFEHPFQPETVFGSLDFLAVLFADGGNKIRVGDAALQKIDVAEELHLGDGKKVPRQHEQRQNFSGKQALVSNVVDGENNAAIAEGRVFDVLGSQQDWNQARLPVMAMENVGYAENL